MNEFIFTTIGSMRSTRMNYIYTNRTTKQTSKEVIQRLKRRRYGHTSLKYWFSALIAVAKRKKKQSSKENRFKKHHLFI